MIQNKHHRKDEFMQGEILLKYVIRGPLVDEIHL